MGVAYPPGACVAGDRAIDERRTIYGHSDSTPGGYLPGKRFLRPLLRHLSLRHEPAARTGLPCTVRHADGKWSVECGPTKQYPECGQPYTAGSRSLPTRHLRPG